MYGQLWQGCEASGCDTEPVCAQCFKCARHCTCDAKAREIKAFHDRGTSDLDRMLAGMVEIVPVPAGIKVDQVGEKLDFSPFGGGVYKKFTPIIYIAPAELAGRYGVHYWYYIGGDDSTQTDKFWVAVQDEAFARKVAADTWLAAKAVKDVAEKARQQEQNALWEKEQVVKAAKKATADAAYADVKAKFEALVPRLDDMTKPAILAETGDLLNAHVIMQSWSKAKIIDAITKYVAGGCVIPRKHDRYEYEVGPDY